MLLDLGYGVLGSVRPGRTVAVSACGVRCPRCSCERWLWVNRDGATWCWYCEDAREVRDEI